MIRLAITLCLLLCALVVPASTLAQDEATDDPLAGRIGGARDSFEAAHGAPTNDPESLVLEYAIGPYGKVEVSYNGDQVFSVSVYADRLAHEPLTEPNDKDWNAARGSQIARQFLPGDVEIHELRQKRSNGDTLVRCRSEALAGAFSLETYREFGFQGEPGDCQFRLHADDEGKFYQVDITLGDGLPQAQTAEPSGDEEPEAQAPDEEESAGELTADEEDYLVTIRDEIFLLGLSWERIGELFGEGEIAFFDPVWTQQVAVVLATWQVLYQTNVERTPPDRYADLHARYVSGLALLDASSRDLAYGIDNIDAAMIEQATAEFQEGADIIVGVLEDVVAELEGAS